MEQSIVGSLINFRGLVYSPINEQGVVFLFGRLLEDLNLYIEEIRIKYPDCVARRYTGKGWERVYIEFEYKASNFIQHGHDPKECNMIVCWENDLSDAQRKRLKGLEVVELCTFIEELENKPIEEPDKINKKSDYDIEHHFNVKKVEKNIRRLYQELDTKIRAIDGQIFNKFSKTAVTYYSPQKNFVYLEFLQSRMVIRMYTKGSKIPGVENINDHENWGIVRLKTEADLATVSAAIKKSHALMKTAISEGINTGWYAVTPKNKMSWVKSDVGSSEDSDS